MAGLLAELPGGHDYTILWNEYDARSTPEARLVADADKLEMVHQAPIRAPAIVHWTNSGTAIVGIMVYANISMRYCKRQTQLR